MCSRIAWNQILLLLFSHTAMSDSLRPHGLLHARLPCFTISQSLLKLMSIELVMPSNHLILCHPLLLPSVFPRIRVFSNEAALHIRWPNYWRFSFSISSSKEYSGLISFRIDGFDLLAVQGTLKVLCLKFPNLLILLYVQLLQGRRKILVYLVINR